VAGGSCVVAVGCFTIDYCDVAAGVFEKEAIGVGISACMAIVDGAAGFDPNTMDACFAFHAEDYAVGVVVQVQAAQEEVRSIGAGEASATAQDFAVVDCNMRRAGWQVDACASVAKDEAAD